MPKGHAVSLEAEEPTNFVMFFVFLVFWLVSVSEKNISTTENVRFSTTITTKIVAYLYVIYEPENTQTLHMMTVVGLNRHTFHIYIIIILGTLPKCQLCVYFFFYQGFFSPANKLVTTSSVD